MSLTNSIVAQNSAAYSGPNIHDDGSNTTISHSLTSGDPLLAPLGDYGGPTQTMPPLPGSPAIDAGDPAFTGPPDTDQRGEGFPRVLNGRIDIGAFEYMPQGIPGLPWVEVLTADRVLVQAIVEPKGFATMAWFEWGLTTNYGNQTLTANIGPTQTAATIRTEISALTPATTYYYRLVTSNTLGVVTMGKDYTFTTPVLAVVETSPASEITTTSAKLNGTAHANAADCYAWFEWGTTLDYSRRTIPVRLASMGTTVTVRTPITGLSPNTEYHFRLMVSNHVGMAAGTDQAFTTLHVPTNLYVWADSPNHAPPYASWDSAAHSIQDAVDASGNRRYGNGHQRGVCHRRKRWQSSQD